MSTLLGSECVAHDHCGLLILGSKTTYFLWSPFRFEWVCLFITFMFRLIMAFHIATFSKSHGFWTYETHWFSAPSGKYEHKWICPLWIKCSIFAVYFYFFGERHLFIIFLSLRLTRLFLSFFFTCPFLSSVSLSFSGAVVCISPFVFYMYRYLLSFYHLFMCNLPLTVSSVCTVYQTWLAERYHVGWLNSHAIGLCVSTTTTIKTTTAAPVK